MVLELVITCLSVITLSLRSSSLLLPLSSAKLILVKFVGYLSQVHYLNQGYILTICNLVTQDRQITHSE